ncbi:hypothetical protein DS831_04735 [Bombilactobacillus bombi]|uniref:Uncharacterized protein n=1 Tax=Bombilactobacillus bombi TaxID=1303590 RepID=A0A3R6WAT6_9LACO|nr:hypothetical protein [Bombilactobacillus bombi]RHW51331.1 hypothetical protein DS831_04735 [Bombilactobacillus bombi]
MAEIELNVPEKPKSPAINVGDFLSLNVSDDKQIQFKNVISYNQKTQNSIIDPAGYVFSEYDQSMIKYLAGQVLQNAFNSLKQANLDIYDADDLENIKSSGFYFIKKLSQYAEVHMRDEKNGIVLILGTMFFYEINDGELSEQKSLKGGENK